jgi:hypothetical protein
MAMRFTMAEGWIVVNAAGMGERGCAAWRRACAGDGLGWTARSSRRSVSARGDGADAAQVIVVATRTLMDVEVGDAQPTGTAAIWLGLGG